MYWKHPKVPVVYKGGLFWQAYFNSWLQFPSSIQRIYANLATWKRSTRATSVLPPFTKEWYSWLLVILYHLTMGLHWQPLFTGTRCAPKTLFRAPWVNSLFNLLSCQLSQPPTWLKGSGENLMKPPQISK